MSHTAEEIKKHVRVDITVLALFVLLTVAHVGIVRTSLADAKWVIALLYAGRFALVTYYFAYLTKGKSAITITLLLTAFFLGVLLILPQLR